MGREEEAALRRPVVDENAYRFLTLDNGLELLLVHDPCTDKAAAACDVRVGSLSDPDDLPGLAHFLEHMLFYSSEKYPEEDAYSKFVAEHGGQTNAYTSSESTNFHFDVNWDALEPALDRFAQFFIKPLISKNGVDREAHAVDSDRFSTGNLDTLLHGPTTRGISVRDRVQQFYEQHYCSRLMRVVIIGRQNLDELEGLGRNAFDPVPCRSLQAPTFSAGATPPEGLLMKAVPERSGHSIELQWLVLPEVRHYTAAPSQYFSHLLGDEGEGSLLALLKSKGWASSLCAGEAGTSFSAASFFMVQIGMTDAGNAHICELTALLFRYLDMLRSPGGISHDVWDDARALAELRFEFAEKSPPYSYASTLAGAMQVYGRADLLLAMHNVPQRFDPDLLQQVLDALQPAAARVLWTSSSFDGEKDCPLREPWYSTPYSAGPLPVDWLASWEAGKGGAEEAGSMHLPPPNQYIPSDFDLIKETSGTPTKLCSAGLCTLWHRPETGFKVPKAAVYLHLRMPESYVTPEAAACTQLLARLLTDHLSEVAYPAELAGLHYGLRATTSGLILSFWGYSHTLPRLVTTVLDSLLEFEVRQDRVDPVKEKQAKDYANHRHEQPYQHALYLLGVGLEARRWHVAEYEAALPRVTAGALDEFRHRLLRTLRIHALAGGNIAAPAALLLMEALEARLLARHSIVPLPSQHPEARVVSLVPGTRAVHAVPGPNPANDNSAAAVVFQVGRDDVRTNALVDLVAHIGKREAFHTLRTVEQLGYITFFSGYWTLTVKNIVIIVQSSAHSSRYLQSRIAAFLPELTKRLHAMPDEEFSSHVEELAKAKLEKPKRLREAINTDWGEIDDATLRFARNEEEAEALRTLTLKETISFFEETVLDQARHRCFSVLVQGETGAGEAVPEGSGLLTRDEIAVTDLYAFKRGQALFPSFL